MSTLSAGASTSNSICVLIVDDSDVAQLLLRHIIEGDPRLRVAGVAADGETALELASSLKPDVILMDIHMNRMDGFEVTRRIMEKDPAPIVICSGVVNHEEASTVFRAMEAGAVACVQKPVGPQHADYERVSAQLRETLRLMSEVKMVRRWPAARMNARPPREVAKPQALRCIGIGASTGGPPALQTILASLPKSFPVPILIVQHIADGFLPGLADWLRQTTPTNVQIAAHGLVPLPGHVYLAPDNYHMGVSAGGQLSLARSPEENGLRPAVSYMFRSLATVCGRRAVGVLLTGMGRDGALELKSMKDAGAVTIAQDRATSIVHGMPGEAIALGGATHILPLERIGPMLKSIVGQQIAPDSCP